MFHILDVILILLDYFSFFIEPFINRAIKRFKLENWSKKRQTNDEQRLTDIINGRPWLLLRNGNKTRAQQSVESSLVGLSQEIDLFCEMQTSRLSQFNELKMNLLMLTKETLSKKWPWASFHLAPIDPLDGQLNWISHDLCLIADWDFPMLAPTLNDCPIDGIQSYTMKIIYSDTVNRLLYLEIKSTLVEDEKSCVFGQEDRTIILSIKWLTPEEYFTHELRSELVFCYTQIYPQLRALYHVAASLLSKARLIRLEATGINDSYHLLPGKTTDRDESSRLNDLSDRKGNLSGYSLILMLAAYLNSEEATQLRKSHAERKHLLAKLLVGFLSVYSLKGQDEKLSLIVRTKEGADKNELELAIDKGSDRKLCGDCQLIVMDPASDATETNESNNLAKHFEPKAFSRLRLLFASLSHHLNNNIANSNGSPLESLLELSAANGIMEPHVEMIFSSGRLQAELDDSMDLYKKEVEKKKVSYKQKASSILGTHNKEPLVGLLMDIKRGAGYSGRRRSIHGPRLSFSNRKVLKNLLYLCIFLLIRNQLINYLLRLRSDLQEQAREDFIQLKYTLFAEDFQMEDALGDDSQFNTNRFLAPDEDLRVNRGAKKESGRGRGETQEEDEIIEYDYEDADDYDYYDENEDEEDEDDDFLVDNFASMFLGRGKMGSGSQNIGKLMAGLTGESDIKSEAEMAEFLKAMGQQPGVEGLDNIDELNQLDPDQLKALLESFMAKEQQVNNEELRVENQIKTKTDDDMAENKQEGGIDSSSLGEDRIYDESIIFREDDPGRNEL